MLAPAVAHRRDRFTKSFTTVRRIGGLASIATPHVNACIFRRSLPLVLERALRARVRELPPDHACHGHDAIATASRFAHEAGLEAQASALFCRDVHRLATAFSAALDRTSLSVRLDVISTDKCRRFHADYKHVRLLCTYVGPGTEWVEERDLDREALRLRDAPDGSTFERTNARIVPDPLAIHRANPGDVLLLKGESYPGNRGRGAVHRSPPIERAKHDTRRLVLTVDVA